MEEQNQEIPSQNLIRSGSSSYREDEISLIDLWQILLRRKRSIFICFIICFIIGGLYIMLKPPVFEATTQIRIGQIAGIGLLEDGNEVCSILLSRYGKDVADGIERELPLLKKVSVSKTSKQVIEITAEANTPQESAAFLRQIVDEVIRRQNTLQQSNLATFKDHIQSLQSQRELLQKELDRASETFEMLKQRDSVQASLIMLEHSRIVTALSEIDQQLPLLQQKLNPPQTIPTEILEEIVAPVEPAAPKKILIIAISCVFGLVTGLMIAFVAEFISNAKSG